MSLCRQDKIAFITLGCAKNEVDSDRMRARVLAGGYGEVDDPALADVVIVNTCSFITEATEEAIATILEVLALPRLVDGTARLIVAGCMPARYGAELANELPEVAAFVSCADEDGIVGVLESVLGRTVPPAAVPPAAVPPPAAVECQGAVAPSRTVSAPWAYVKIADGCNRFCSFCTIPHIRGRYRSALAPEIISEVAGLVEGGVREIVLIAQDTGIWGHDLKAASGAPSDLASLLDLLATRFPQTWFRVMYLQPQGITDELLAVMAKHANICNYLDIPLQHASARVLKEMNRTGSGEDYLALLARIRQALPDVALRTTLIAGFPGETRADARELERFVEKAAFDYVGVFLYSREDGTVAGWREDQVSPRTRRARAQRLRDLADAIGFARAAARVGTTENVLITERDEGSDEGSDGCQGDGCRADGCQGDVHLDTPHPPDTRIDASTAPPPPVHPLLGRTMRQAPEVDGMVHVELGQGHIGEVFSVTMIDSYCYELDGRIEGASYV
jgi:ribosomal protein S12 methylthiotransferase